MIDIGETGALPEMLVKLPCTRRKSTMLWRFDLSFGASDDRVSRNRWKYCDRDVPSVDRNDGRLGS